MNEENAKWWTFVLMAVAVVLAVGIIFIDAEDTIITGQAIYETTYNNTIIQPVKETIITSTAINGDMLYKEGRKIACNEWYENNMAMKCKQPDGSWQCFINRVPVENYLCEQ